MDPTRCKEKVPERFGFGRYYQCQREHKPGSEYCSQHDPAAVAERDRKSTEAFRKKQEEWRLGYQGRTLLNALLEIANGSNDARAVALKALADTKRNLSGEFET